MNYQESTHRSTWLFAPEKLEQLRLANLQRALAGSAAATDAPLKQLDHHVSSDADCVTVAEEQALLQYYSGKIQVLAQQMGFPRKVMLTALMFFKRFYLARSVIEADPVKFMLTAVYLACKAEESYISAEEFCRTVHQEQSSVLQNEVTLLQGLRFDLVVHSPLWSLRGLFADFDAWRQQPGSSADERIRGLPSQVLQQADVAAQAAINTLMLTDAPLLYPPGSVALTAISIAFHEQSVDISGFLARTAEKSQQACRDSHFRDDALQQLRHTLASLQALRLKGLHTISDEQVRAIDRKCKVHKKKKKAAKAT